MESNHEVAFDEIIKQLSCFAYTLQLVVNKFIDRVVLQVLVSAHTLVNKLSSAHCARLCKTVQDCCHYHYLIIVLCLPIFILITSLYPANLHLTCRLGTIKSQYISCLTVKK